MWNRCILPQYWRSGWTLTFNFDFLVPAPQNEPAIGVKAWPDVTILRLDGCTCQNGGSKSHLHLVCHLNCGHRLHYRYVLQETFRACHCVGIGSRIFRGLYWKRAAHIAIIIIITGYKKFCIGNPKGKGGVGG